MGFQETFNERVIPATERAFGVSITLVHGSVVTDPFVATWEKRSYEVADGEGFLTSLQSRDFMFAVAAATGDGETFEPRAGDRIRVVENGNAVEYELLPIGNFPAAELLPGGYRWKVHAKRVA